GVFALLRVDDLVAKLVGLVGEGLLLRRVLLGIRLHPEQDVLVGHRFHVVGIQRERLVLHREALQDVVALVGGRQAIVLVCLLPVERGDAVITLVVVAFGLCALLND